MYVPVNLKKGTNDFHKRNFELVKTRVAKQDLDDNAISTLKQADKVMTFFRKLEQTTLLDIERDQTIQDEAKGAVAGRDDDGDEGITTPGMSRRPPGSSATATNLRS